MTTTAGTAVVAGGAATTMTDEPRTATQPTEPARSAAAGRERRPPRRPSKPRAGWLFGGALGAFFAALALLAFQVRAGHDPALGPAQPVAQVQQPRPRRILIRKVIKRVVVHHPAAAEPPSEAAASSAPSTTSSAPAPAPAPLTTQSS